MTTVHWNFGDGDENAIDAPASQPVDYTYTVPGRWNVTGSEDGGQTVFAQESLDVFGFANAAHVAGGSWSMGTVWLGSEAQAKFAVTDATPTSSPNDAWVAQHGLANAAVWPDCVLLRIDTYTDPVQALRADFVSGSVADVLGAYVPTSAGTVWWTIHVLGTGGATLATYPLTFTVAT